MVLARLRWLGMPCGGRHVPCNADVVGWLMCFNVCSYVLAAASVQRCYTSRSSIIVMISRPKHSRPSLVWLWGTRELAQRKLPLEGGDKTTFAQPHQLLAARCLPFSAIDLSFFSRKHKRSLEGSSNNLNASYNAFSTSCSTPHAELRPRMPSTHQTSP